MAADSTLVEGGLSSNFALETFDRTDRQDPRWPRSGRGRVIRSGLTTERSPRRHDGPAPAAGPSPSHQRTTAGCRDDLPEGTRRRGAFEPTRRRGIRRSAPGMSRLADRRAGFSAQTERPTASEVLTQVISSEATRLPGLLRAREPAESRRERGIAPRTTRPCLAGARPPGRVPRDARQTARGHAAGGRLIACAAVRYAWLNTLARRR